MSKKSAGEQVQSYAAAAQELERILDEIERGAADVDVLSEKVERAARLIRLCRDKISGAELKVRKVLEELDTAAAAAAAGAGAGAEDGNDVAEADER